MSFSHVSYVQEFFNHTRRDTSLYPVTVGDSEFNVVGYVAMRMFSPRLRPSTRVLIRVAKGKSSGYHVSVVTSTSTVPWEIVRVCEALTWADALTVCRLVCAALDKMAAGRTTGSSDVRHALSDVPSRLDERMSRGGDR